MCDYVFSALHNFTILSYNKISTLLDYLERFEYNLLKIEEEKCKDDYL